MSREFEEIVSNLEDIDKRYEQVDVPVAYGGSISVGWSVEHAPDCNCDKRLIFLTINIFERDEPIQLAVPVDSPLGVSILEGSLERGCKKMLDELT